MSEGMKTIKCRLRVLMAEREPPVNQAQLIRETGLYSNTVSKLYNNNFIRLDVRTIEILMEYLKCELNDLFVTVERE
ncbi:MAG: helix-turn-helix transcriptional regulator [Cyanobacteria bacterium P01_A01_bin.17]